MSWTGVDWPTAIVSVVGGILATGVGLLLRGLYLRYVLKSELLDKIHGTWYCAEFDPKGVRQPNKPHMAGEPSNKKVKITRTLRGMFRIKMPEPTGEGSKVTQWVADCKTKSENTLVGMWKSELKDTGLHGALLLKFMEGGYAVGYWLADWGHNGLGCGYMVLCRDEKGAEELGSECESHFTGFNVFQCATKWLEPPVGPKQRMTASEASSTD